MILAIEKGALRSLISQTSWHSDILCFIRETTSICFPWKSDLPWRKSLLNRRWFQWLTFKQISALAAALRNHPWTCSAFLCQCWCCLPLLEPTGVTSSAHGDPLGWDGPLCFVRGAQGNPSFGDHGEVLNSCERIIFNWRGLECLGANHKDYSFTVNSSGVSDCP